MSVRKRDKFIGFFWPDESQAKVKTQPKHEATTGHTPKKSFAKEKALPEVPNSNSVSLSIFPNNLDPPIAKIKVPKMGDRIDKTPQLSLCLALLAKNQQSASSDPETPAALLSLSEDELTWIKAIEKEPVEEHKIHWLAERLVENFIQDDLKDSDPVIEIVSVGPMLKEDHFKTLLNCFIEELEKARVFKVVLLQGLVELVQGASPGYLQHDDFVNILATIRSRLQKTSEQSPDHQYHLTLAVSRLLDVMARHEVKEVDRVEHHEPLSKVLSSLRKSSDPFLMYQASYAFQALQFVPDNETVLHEVMRRAGVAVGGLIKISGVVHLNFSNFLEGLAQLQTSIVETIEIVKNATEGIPSLIQNGQDVLATIQSGPRAVGRRAWYAAIIGAEAFVQEGRLADFKELVLKAPCRLSPEFQWGICQLLGEITLDPFWEITTRQQAVDFLIELHTNDHNWAQDDSVRSWMLTIFHIISEDPDLINARAKLLQCISDDGGTKFTKYYPLRSHLPFPVASPLLTKVQNIPYVEYELNRLKLQRLEQLEAQRREDYSQAYISPRAKTIPAVSDQDSDELLRKASGFSESEQLETQRRKDSRQAYLPHPKTNSVGSDQDSFELLGKVKGFLKSEQQVFLVIGDSGAGKSTFNRHLEEELLISYRPGEPFPLFIHLPLIKNSETALISEPLTLHHIPCDIIDELRRQRRQLIIICDSYDESLLRINLHTSNSFNQPGQWKVKMIISCRSAHLSAGYESWQFLPQPSSRFSPSTPHLFQIAAIVPFSSDQIKSYVDQFVKDPDVKKLFKDRPLWSAEEYMAQLRSVPSLDSLITNPFLLSVSLRVLPIIADDVNGLKGLSLTRAGLYKIFVDQWLQIGERQLKLMKFDDLTTIKRDQLTGGGNFSQIVIKFLEELATCIYQEQDGNPVVRYEHSEDGGTWKDRFFNDEDRKAVLIRIASPLTRSGALHQFIHRTLLQYLYSFEEHEVYMLKNKRIHTYHDSIYTPVFAKSSLQENNGETFPLLGKAKEFLESDQRVFLVLGGAASGKTSFLRYLERDLWKEYKEGGRIPLFIILRDINNPKQDLIGKQLRYHGFDEHHIRNVEQHRQIILICDGYDEAHHAGNIYMSNFPSQKDQRNIKMIISCRSTVIGEGYQDLFQPQPRDGFVTTPHHLFTEATIVPFSRDQIEDYVDQFVQAHDQHFYIPLWSTKDYMDSLNSMPSLMDMVRMPFLLHLSLTTLPGLAKKMTNLTQVTRLALYDSFVNSWLDVNRRRLISMTLSMPATRALDALLDDDIRLTAVNFLKNLAADIFRGQNGVEAVEYLPGRDNETWKYKFFGSSDPSTKLLLEMSPLMRMGAQYQFIHRSWLEYFYARHIYEWYIDNNAIPGQPLDLADGPLSQRNIITEPSVIQFLIEHVQNDPTFKETLRKIVEQSTSDISTSQAAANAVTILVRAGVSL